MALRRSVPSPLSARATAWRTLLTSADPGRSRYFSETSAQPEVSGPVGHGTLGVNSRRRMVPDAMYGIALLGARPADGHILLKDRVSDPASLVAAIREFARGGSVGDPAVVEALISARVQANQSQLAELTAQ